MSFTAQNKDFNEALRLHQKGDLRQAERLYRKSLKRNPHLVEAYQNLGVLLVDQQRQLEGIRVMERGLEMDPRHAGLLSALGSVFLGMGKREAAKKHAQALVTYHPDKAEAYYNLAHHHVSEGEYVQAIKLYDRAIELNMRFAEAYYNKGLAHYQVQEMDEAKSAFKTCIEIDPSMISAKVNLGQVHAEEAEYDQATALLKEVLEREPNHAKAHQQMGVVRHLSSDLATAEKHLRQALQLGLETGELHTLLGNVYRDLGDEKKAQEHYSRALEIDPEDKLAQRNLHIIQGSKIAGWHFVMLADGARNLAYHQAIKACVEPGDTVFDIGAGTGLLSMMAAKAGAGKVVACEVMDIIAESAREIVKLNGFEDRVKVVSKRSTSMVEGRDFEEKADLLVSEIFDAGLLGEGVLPTLRHAHASLLKKGGRVLPKAAAIECMALQVDDLKRVHPLREIEGFDLSPFNKFNSREEYKGVHLAVTPHRPLSKPQVVKVFDFEHLESPASAQHPVRKNFRLKIDRDGEMQGIAFWFILHLDDEHRVSSGPGGEMVHWGQAVHFLHEPVTLKAGDELSMDICNSETRIWFELAQG